MWFYNTKLQAWFHPAGLRVDRDESQPPTAAEEAVLMAQQAQAETPPQYVPGGLQNPVEDCGCGGIRDALP